MTSSIFSLNEEHTKLPFSGQAAMASLKSAEQWEKEVRRVRDCIRTPLRVKVR